MNSNKEKIVIITTHSITDERYVQMKSFTNYC